MIQTKLEKLSEEIRKSLDAGETIINMGKIEIKDLSLGKMVFSCSCGSNNISKKYIPYSYSKQVGEDTKKYIFHEEYEINKFCSECKKTLED